MKYTDPLFGEPSDEPRDELEHLGEPAMTSYAMLMWRLQEMCGLTYKEARAHLMDPREDHWVLAETFGVTLAAVVSLQTRAMNKIKSSGYSLEEIYGNYGYIMYVVNRQGSAVTAAKRVNRHR